MSEQEYFFSVKIKLRQGDRLTRAAAKKYVREAVQSYRGCYPCDSDEYALNNNQITVNDMYPARKE